MNHVIEVAIFRLTADADEAQFLKEAQATFDLLNTYAGFINRELNVTDEGLWVDVVTWESMDKALAAGERFMQDPTAQSFMQYINPDTVQMIHARPRISSLQTA